MTAGETHTNQGPIPDLPQAKRDALAQEVGIYMQQGLAAGADPVQLLSQRAMEFMALAKALSPGGPFAGHYTHHLTQHINAMLTDPSTHVPMEEVALGVDNMLIKRQREAIQSADLLCDPAFIESLPQAVQGMAFGMSDKKLNDIARRLAQPDDPNGVDAPIHITGSAVGSQLLHKAMISVYDPKNGPLTEPLTQILQHVLPSLNPERTQLLARGWLNDRYKAAVNATEAVTPNAPARNSALNYAHNDIATRYQANPADTVQAQDSVQAGTVSHQPEREVK